MKQKTLFSPSQDQNDITCLHLFLIFFRIGLTTFGGGFSMAAVLRHELVLKRQWLRDKEFFNTLSLATSIPGAVAVNLAFLEGHRIRGFRGAIAAVAGQIFPSIMVILLIANFAVSYFEQPLVSAFLKGASIAVTGQIAFATITFARKLRLHWQNALACCLGLVVVIAGFHPVWAIVVAACSGYMMMHQRMTKQKWTENDEMNLLGLVDGIAAPELVENSPFEEVKGVIQKRNEMVKDQFDTIIEDSCVLDLDKTMNRDDFFELVADKLAKKLNLDVETLATSLQTQETESSTVLNQRLAVPHLVIETDKDFEILVARSRKGIKFSKHAKKVNAIFVIVGSIKQKDFYLCSLAAITQITSSTGFIERWFQAKDPEELKKIIISARKKELENICCLKPETDSDAK
ncbi:MAG: chromate transporter [Myxococcota bacterium]